MTPSSSRRSRCTACQYPPWIPTPSAPPHHPPLTLPLLSPQPREEREPAAKGGQGVPRRRPIRFGLVDEDRPDAGPVLRVRQRRAGHERQRLQACGRGARGEHRYDDRTLSRMCGLADGADSRVRCRSQDAPYRATVLDPVGKLCSYWPEINAAIAKRQKKVCSHCPTLSIFALR